MAEISGLISNSEEIDPSIIEEFSEVLVRLNDNDDAENLERALLELENMKKPYDVRHEKSEDGRFNYAFLHRRAA